MLAVTDVVEITATDIIRRLGGIYIENIFNSFDISMYKLLLSQVHNSRLSSTKRFTFSMFLKVNVFSPFLFMYCFLLVVIRALREAGVD